MNNTLKSNGSQGQIIPPGAFKKQKGGGYQGGATRNGVFTSPGKNQAIPNQNLNGALRGSGAKFYN